MAINPVMMAALKALSYPDIDVARTYKVERALNSLSKPVLISAYKMLDLSISRDGCELPVRLFFPEEQTGDDILMFFHGGGWVTGNIDSYTKPCRALADFTGRRVASVDYRLAPENPFPCGVEDCYFAARELYRHAEELGTRPEDLTLIGDSAGGNIAAAVSLMARDREEFFVGRQILIYPAVYNVHDESSPYASIAENGSDFLLKSKRIREFISLYLQNPEDYQNPYFAPLLAGDLSNQPRTLILSAEYCPLRDEGEDYGIKLMEQGNDVVIHRVPDALHGSFVLPVAYPTSYEFYDAIKNFLDEESDAE